MLIVVDVDVIGFSVFLVMVLVVFIVFVVFVIIGVFLCCRVVILILIG